LGVRVGVGYGPLDRPMPPAHAFGRPRSAVGGAMPLIAFEKSYGDACGMVGVVRYPVR